MLPKAKIVFLNMYPYVLLHFLETDRVKLVNLIKMFVAFSFETYLVKLQNMCE